MRGGAGLRAALIGAVLLVGCDSVTPRQSPVPPARPAALRPAPAPAPGPSARSEALRVYYRSVQSDLLTRGLLRTDGGGPDTAYDADDLSRNFEDLVFFKEFTPSGTRADAATILARWRAPVRMQAEFGPSVPADQRKQDQALVNSYAARLGRITGHSISAARTGANFHILVAGEDDQTFIETRLKALFPDLPERDIAQFLNIPRSIYCQVLSFSGGDNSATYTRAVALIRAEHPDQVRRACFHEELAQGLGFANDSLRARPSIFNDDDEFALLTSHDEKLLKMLYDPRLRPGITADEARPVFRIIARELMGQPL